MASIFRRVPTGRLPDSLLYGGGAAQSITAEFFEPSGAANAAGALATATTSAPTGAAAGKASATGATIGSVATTAGDGVGSAQAHASAALPTITASSAEGSASGSEVQSVPGSASGDLPSAYAFEPEATAAGLGTRVGGSGGGKPAPYVLPHTLRGIMARRAGEGTGEIPTAHALPLDGFAFGGSAKVSAATMATRERWTARLTAGRGRAA